MLFVISCDIVKLLHSGVVSVMLGNTYMMLMDDIAIKCVHNDM